MSIQGAQKRNVSILCMNLSSLMTKKVRQMTIADVEYSYEMNNNEAAG